MLVFDPEDAIVGDFSVARCGLQEPDEPWAGAARAEDGVVCRCLAAVEEAVEPVREAGAGGVAEHPGERLLVVLELYGAEPPARGPVGGLGGGECPERRDAAGDAWPYYGGYLTVWHWPA